jgi:hypothetical protein
MAVGVPWEALPSDMSHYLQGHLAGVVEEIVRAVPVEVPDYARPIEGAFGQGLRLGVEVAMRRFLDLPGTTEPALRGEDRRVYVALGRGELRQGRELQTLLAAYRVGARVAFRRFATLVREGGFDADVLVPLAESVFAYIDELSATSVEGYAQEQSLRAGEDDRRRGELLALLLAGTADGPALTAAAGQAKWQLPDMIVTVVLPPGRADGLAIRLGRTALVGPDGDLVLALLPALSGALDRDRLMRQLAGRAAVVGPACPLAGLQVSRSLARQALAMVEAGALRGDPLLVEDHLAALVIHRDPELLAVLSAARLAPLLQVKPAARQRLADTLLAWLQHRGERQHVAAALHVHPQTVGYRLGQLRELFGEALESPDARFELELALRGGGLGPGSSRSS